MILADKTGKILKLKNTCLIIMATYLFLAVAFYYLAGEQLHFRDSRANIDMPVAEIGTVELIQGNVIEQQFVSNIQRLKEVSVQWGTYYRENEGTVTMELYDMRDNSIVLEQKFDISAIEEGGISTMTCESPIEGLCGVPLLLRVQADSLVGKGISPLMSTIQKDNFILDINGNQINGTLCFSVTGEDYVWLGLHYWQFVVVFGIVLGAYLIWAYRNYHLGKASVLTTGLLVLKKYKFLIKQLVSRDFKIKYKRSVLGIFWSFLNPLLVMIVQYIVFSNLFRFDIPHYIVYLLCGIVMYNYFSESCGMALGSITGNASLITKVYVPKYIYPLTKILSSFINLLIAIIPLLVVALFSGIVPTKAYILTIYPMLCLGIFCLGLGMLLGAGMVFFRDLQFIWSVMSMVWMYMTPIFYPASILPETVAWVLKVNPLYYYVDFVRTCIIDGVSPEPILYAQCMVSAVLMLIIGAVVFKKNQDKFVLYL